MASVDSAANKTNKSGNSTVSRRSAFAAKSAMTLPPLIEKIHPAISDAVSNLYTMGEKTIQAVSKLGKKFN